jgi:iron(III) transport system permease protein
MPAWLLKRVKGRFILKHKGFITPLIYLLLIFFVGYFILFPVINVFVYGLFPDEADKSMVFDYARSFKHLNHSFFIAGMVTLLSTLFGLAMSFCLTRIKFAGRGLLRVLALLPLVNPPFVGSIAFIMLFGKRGLITNKLLGLSISPFGWYGIVVIQVLGLSTFAYLLISSSIKKVDTSLEDAARNLGASEFGIFKDITFPMMVPEICGTALLVFLSSLSDFGTPLIIGGDYQTLASDLYIQITGLYDMKSAAISGIILLILCVMVFLIYKYYVQRKIYFTENNGSLDIEYKQISPAAKGIIIGITTIFIGFVVLNFSFIIIGAFTRSWGNDYTFTLEHFSLALGSEWGPFLNSIKLSVIVAVIASFLGVITSYMIKNRASKTSKVIDFIITLPAAVPGILFGIGYLVTFKYSFLGIGKYILTDLDPVILLGTNVIVYLICIARYANVGVRSGYAMIDHMDPELEKAAYNLGAGKIFTFTTVILPLLKDAVISAFYKNFSTTMTTLGAIIFLITPSNKVAVQQIFQIITSSSVGDAAAMALMLSFTILIFLGVFKLLFYRKNLLLKVKKRCE